jgi:hypothetical protein
LGAGADLVAACDWRIAAPATRFRMPGLRFGIVLGTRRFAALVGADAAHEILVTSRSFGASASILFSASPSPAPGRRSSAASSTHRSSTASRQCA